jgi:hypothetical protein
MTTKDNPKLHLFYKELFGKPSHKKHEEILLLDKGKPDPLFGTAYSPFRSTFQSKQMRRAVSQEQIKNNTFKEQHWINNFNVMGSKNNDRVHKHFQEYFDRPVEYDNQGYKPGIGEFGEIYHEISPTKTMQFHRGSKHTTLSSFKHRLGKTSAHGSSHPAITPELNTRGTENEDDEGDVEKQRTHRIHNSKAIQKAILKHRGHGGRRNFRRSLDRDFPNHKQVTPIDFRGSKVSPADRKKEQGWKKIGDPISTYNELVHKSYRIGFDRL